MNFFNLLLLVLLGSNASFNMVEALSSEEIVGGNVVRKREFKYVVAIMYKARAIHDQNPCTGSILSDWFIITVAHCFYDKIFGEWRKSLFYIIAGTNNLDVLLPSARQIKVDKITVPINYNPDNPDNHGTEGNLAVVKIAESLELAVNNKTLTRLVPRRLYFQNLSAIYSVAGFGLQVVDVSEQLIYGRNQYIQKGRRTGKLYYAKANIISMEECQIMLRDFLAPGIICAKSIRLNENSPVGICEYDSGAPLSHQSYLDGIAINGGLYCDEKISPGIYINVLEYITFIVDAISETESKNMLVLEHRMIENEYTFEAIRMLD